MSGDKANLLGATIIKAGLVTQEQLDECTNIQKSELAAGNNVKLGEVLIKKGYLKQEELNKVLRGDFAAPGKRFGEICVYMDLADTNAVTVALKEQAALRQKGEAKKIGAILVELGALKSEQIGTVLRAQGLEEAECNNCNLTYNFSLDSDASALSCAKCGAELLFVTGYEDINAEEIVANDIKEIPIEQTFIVKKSSDDEEVSPEEAMAALGITTATIEQFGDFKIHSKLGDDHAGVLYSGEHPETKVGVTLKLMHAAVMQDAAYAKSFIEKTKKAAALKHDNLKRLLAVGKEQGIYYYAAEYLDGASLRTTIQESGRIELIRALEIGRTLATVLKHAHSNNVFHGDIKPSLVQITSGNVVKLSEIGLQKDVRANVERLAASMGVVPCYMAPELAVPGKEADATSDIYGLGATMFHMITGQPPFRGKTPIEIFMHMAQDEPPKAHKLSQNVPESIGILLAEMMNPEPPERISSMDVILERIEKELSTLAPKPAAEPAPSPEPEAKPKPKSKKKRDTNRRQRKPQRAEKQKKSLAIPVLIFVLLAGLITAAVYYLR